MTGDVEQLLAWLRRERRVSVVQEILWIQHFDLDGALAARQPELVWRARGALLVFGIELYLRTCGINPPATIDITEAARVMMRRLGILDPDLAGEAWEIGRAHV